MDRYPDAKVSVTHGFPWRDLVVGDRIERPGRMWEPFRDRPNRPSRSASRSGSATCSTTRGAVCRRSSRRWSSNIGADRLLWGTDMPFQNRFCTYRQSREWIERYSHVPRAGPARGAHGRDRRPPAAHPGRLNRARETPMTETAIPNFTFDETARLMAEGSQWLPGGAISDYRLGDGGARHRPRRGRAALRRRRQPPDRLLLRRRADHPRPRRAGGRRGRDPPARPRRPARRRDASRSTRRPGS